MSKARQQGGLLLGRKVLYFDADIREMFAYAESFHQQLDDWKTLHVEEMGYLQSYDDSMKELEIDDVELKALEQLPNPNVHLETPPPLD